MAVREVPFTELLSHIVDNRGRTCPTSDSGMPLIATNCVRNDLLYPAYEKVRHVSDDTYRSWFRGHPEPGDLIFVCKGSPGRVCLTPDPVGFCIAQDMVAVRADPAKVYPRYLFAALRSDVVQQRIGNMHVGTLIPHFKKGDFDKLLVPMPDYGQQLGIGDLYFTLSAKIELNRRMNATLEGISRAIFKSWFVDFDPVRQKAAGKQPVGMDAETAALFPDSFEESEIGEVPKGWRVREIGEFAAVEKGLSYKGSGLVEEGAMPMVNLGCFQGAGKFAPDKLKQYAGEYAERHLVSGGDLLVANTDMTQNRLILGSPAIIPESTPKNAVLFTHHVFTLRFRPEAKHLRRYVYYWLLRPDFRTIAEGFATGTTVLALPKEAILTHPVCLPLDGVLNAFTEQSGHCANLCEVYDQQSHTLTALRDTLLPKLLSGEIRVPEAEQIVAKAMT
jgi:type I restriction enzyme S subunit